MTKDMNDEKIIQNRIECDDGSLLCKWHREGGVTILEGKHGSLSFDRMIKQLSNPKPDKVGRHRK